MKFIPIIAAALAVASPAFAADNSNFTGVRAELNAGYNNVKNHSDANDVNYGAAVGVDVPLGESLVVGVEGTSDNVFQKTREYGASARIGVAFDPHFLVYGKAGYADYHDVHNFDYDGLRVGGGVEYALTRNAYVKAEYRYSDFANHVGEHGALAGVGIRF